MTDGAERSRPRDFARQRTLPVGVLAVLIVVTMFVPWSKTGASVRSGYALAHAAEAAGLVSGAPAHALLDAVFALPMAVGLACAALVLGRVRLAAFLVALCGIVAVVASVVVLRELHASAEIGPWLGLVTGGLATTLSIAVTLRKRDLLVRNF